MPTYKDSNNTVVGEISVLAKYFRMPSESLTDFSAQLKKLTPEAKTELAIGAAKEMGWTVQD